MNDVMLTQLKIAVERALRPVRATMARKRQMREELLAHLAAIFEEELGRTGDEQAALTTAGRRFGDPRELSGQLQETVPWWNRFEAYSDEQYFPRPGESLWHFAMRHVLFISALYAVFAATVLPVALLRVRQGEMWLAMRVLLVASVLGITISFLTAFFIDRLGRALYGAPSGRSRTRAGAYFLESVFIFPAIAFFTYWALTGDLAASLQRLSLGCCFAPVAPVVLWAAARQTARERRGEEEWTSLPIEE